VQYYRWKIRLLALLALAAVEGVAPGRAPG
jgi:hypothetical protein